MKACFRQKYVRLLKTWKEKQEKVMYWKFETSLFERHQKGIKNEMINTEKNIYDAYSEDSEKTHKMFEINTG